LRIGVVVKFLGLLVLVLTAWMLLPLGYSLLSGGDDAACIAKASAVSLACSLLALVVSREAKMSGMGAREAIASVALSWVAASAVGGLPYLFYGIAASYTDAFFEAMSGYTTTGSTVLTGLDGAPGGLLLWHSLTHWLGGMGIIVLTLAIMPTAGAGGFQMYRAEVPGITHKKLTPRVQGTALILWLMYLALTAVLAALLLAGGMELFDSVIHAMSVISTGGFSIRKTSVAYYDSAYFDWVMTLFMFISGANFVLLFRALKGRSPSVFKADPEFVFYTGTVFAFSLLASLCLYLSGTYETFLLSCRFGFFQVVSLITTTGFVSANYDGWPYFVRSLLFICILMGGCTGSTSGAIKQARLLVMFSHVGRRLTRILSPKSVLPLRMGSDSVEAGVAYSCFAFLGLYAFVFATGVFLVALFETDLFTVISGVASALGNVGPAFDELGPAYDFAAQATGAKWVYAFLMLCGRLELYTVLALFTRTFWKGGIVL
jgi:trk system potassium uptake protein TrkH